MNRYSKAAIWCILTVTYLLLFTNSFAQSEEQISEELHAYIDAITNAEKVAIKGPSKIELLDQATLELKEGYAFIPKNEASAILNAIGNPTSDDLIGLVGPADLDLLWYIDIYFFKTGYISDSDAQSWNPDEILEDIKYLTEEGNKEIDQRNLSKLEVLGWIKAPNYDPKTHELTWSISLKETLDGKESLTTNLQIRKLGRQGYFSVLLVSEQKDLELNLSHINSIIDGTQFSPGKSHSDYVLGDKLAGYGLSSLISGNFESKTGIIALALVALAKVYKFLIAALLLVCLFIGNKLFLTKNNKNDYTKKP